MKQQSKNIFDLVLMQTHKLIGKTNPTIILGLSGGPDSVFLFHVLASMHKSGDLTMVAAHLDHEWRTSSGADAQFCVDLCYKSGILLVSAKASELSINIKFNGSHEDVGRRLRRYFFQQVKQKYNADAIALAHHRQDQQETFFLRLIRGTTLSGLTCMKYINTGNTSCCFRPLLAINKQEIITYLTDNNLSFCIDPTNESTKYLRNRIRTTIIPALTNIDNRFDQKFDDTIAHLQEEDAYIQKLAYEHFEKIFSQKTLQVIGNLTEFRKLHPVMQKRVLMIWIILERVTFTPSFRFLQELINFINRPAGASHKVGSWAIVKNGACIWIEEILGIKNNV